MTLFPEAIPGVCGIGVVGRALESGLFHLNALNLRDYGEGKHRIIDDTPYGGGDGMIMKPAPLAQAIEDARRQMPPQSPVLLMSPLGQRFDQALARELAQAPGLIFLCGRYEGIDERIRMHFVDREISLGDFVLSGGEAAALTMLDAITRLLPGVLGNPTSTQDESFQRPLLEYPHYTRPPLFRGLPVPPILQSGHHEKIRRWRFRESLKRTLLHRPDLLQHLPLDRKERRILDEIKEEIAQERPLPPQKNEEEQDLSQHLSKHEKSHQDTQINTDDA
jgi:tRNA (guanine37-N1)-methyltransferase